ncbi:radical SAM protein [Trichothermofontia sp.]
MSDVLSAFCSVYGPVKSWRFGQSLGIDPIGPVSTCSFNCVYCQLGEIQQKISDRRLFVPTAQIAQDLNGFAPWDVDIITLSGSGEPTLALNLGDILTRVKTMTGRPTAVLTNGTMLKDAQVRSELAIADRVAVKLDAVTPDQLRRVDRAVPAITWESLWQGICQFRCEYRGFLAVQTMLLSPWSAAEQDTYVQLLRDLQPDEAQLNVPTRPKPLTYQLDARGNHEPEGCPYPVQILKQVQPEVLVTLADRIQAETAIPVRMPPHLAEHWQNANADDV